MRHAELLDSEDGEMSRPNGKADGVTSAIGPKAHEIQQLDSAVDGDKRKAFTTMQARAALCGCSLNELADGAFLVSRWNYSKSVPCLRAVADLLSQIGGRE